MKRSVLLLAGVCIAVLGILGYTLLYASSGSDTNKEECATECTETSALQASMFGADCPYSAKEKAYDGCCADKGSAAKADGACKGHAKVCDSKAKAECMKGKGDVATEIEKSEEGVSLD